MRACVTGRGESWGAGFGAGKDEPKDACYPTPDYTVSERVLPL